MFLLVCKLVLFKDVFHINTWLITLSLTEPSFVEIDMKNELIVTDTILDLKQSLKIHILYVICLYVSSVFVKYCVHWHNSCLKLMFDNVSR